MKKNRTYLLIVLILMAGCGKKTVHPEPFKLKPVVVPPKEERLFRTIKERAAEEKKKEDSAKVNNIPTEEAPVDYRSKMFKSEAVDNEEEILEEIISVDYYNSFGSQVNPATYFGVAMKPVTIKQYDYYRVKTWRENRDCLWNISGQRNIYNNPRKWTVIYKANKDVIKNPDLIYPDQVLRIPRW